MPDFEYVVDGHIGLMRFNRPEKMNAITYEMLVEIEGAVRLPAAMSACALLCLRAPGARSAPGPTSNSFPSTPPTTGRAEAYGDSYDLSRPAPWTFASIAKPTVCAVNGAAVGLGVEFTSQCDIRIAGESARFGWVFVHRGLVPDTAAGTWLLSRIVGLQNAAYLLYSGEIISAARAKEIGYVMDVVPDAELLDRSMAVAHAVSKGGPLATARGQAAALSQHRPRPAGAPQGQHRHDQPHVRQRRLQRRCARVP